MKGKAIILDHDGSADDFLSLILLLSMSNIAILGITITPADCYMENALETTLKILHKANRTDIEVGLGGTHGVNAFPADWRAKPKIYNALPEFINIPIPTMFFRNSSEVLIDKITRSNEPVTILLTGPCSNLVKALEICPDIARNIEEIIWMGGAIDVPGNVVTYNHNGTAEWNVFWDPISAKKLLDYDVPIVFIPLDVTNQVPVTIEFLKTLAQQSKSFWSNIAGQFWATTLNTIPAYEYIYFMWDVLATSYVSIPKAFTLEDVEISIDTIGASAGRTYRCKKSGRKVKIAKYVNTSQFYNFLLNSFKHDF